jgi:hypothetical protein
MAKRIHLPTNTVKSKIPKSDETDLLKLQSQWRIAKSTHPSSTLKEKKVNYFSHWKIPKLHSRPSSKRNVKKNVSPCANFVVSIYAEKGKRRTDCSPSVDALDFALKQPCHGSTTMCKSEFSTEFLSFFLKPEIFFQVQNQTNLVI